MRRVYRRVWCYSEAEALRCRLRKELQGGKTLTRRWYSVNYNPRWD